MKTEHLQQCISQAVMVIVATLSLERKGPAVDDKCSVVKTYVTDLHCTRHRLEGLPMKWIDACKACHRISPTYRVRVEFKQAAMSFVPG